ncbi:MAG: hypothetical protein ABI072_00685 [Edaphobacter sp.]
MAAAPQDGVAIDGGSVRATQSLVQTSVRCLKRPAWLLEVVWRWAFGGPALLALWYEARRILSVTPVDVVGLQNMSLVDIMGAAETMAKALEVLVPPVLQVMRWLGPLLVVAWVVVSAVGRTWVLRRLDDRLHARVGTLIVLHALRAVALLGTFAVWFVGVRWAAESTVTGPMLAGNEPNLVGYCSLVIVMTLGMFSLWAVASWALSAAPLLAMLRGLGVRESLAAAFRVGPLKMKLVEINLAMGVVKIALMMLATILSSTPLPFEGVATPGFLHWWWTGSALVYFVASDFFHVARLMAYLELWRAHEGVETLPVG